MLNVALTAYSDAVSLLLRGQVERRALMDNLDLALLCLDETIDDGCVHDCKADALLIVSAELSSKQMQQPLRRALAGQRQIRLKS